MATTPFLSIVAETLSFCSNQAHPCSEGHHGRLGRKQANEARAGKLHVGTKGVLQAPWEACSLPHRQGFRPGPPPAPATPAREGALVLCVPLGEEQEPE